jgi:hypothetical protein
MRRPTSPPLGGRVTAVVRRIPLPEGVGRLRGAKAGTAWPGRPKVSETVDREDRRPAAPPLRDRLRR